MRLGTLLAALGVATGLAVIGGAAEPGIVTVRFIDARDGKPYVDKTGPVRIMFYKVDPSKVFNARAGRDSNLVGTIRAFSDANGEARFTLPSPMPGVIKILFFPAGCGPPLFDTREVVERGVVGQNHCRTKLRKMNVKFEAKPGGIIDFVAPPRLWNEVTMGRRR